MWQTGYKGQTVEDKLKRGLNYKLEEDWISITAPEHMTMSITITIADRAKRGYTVT